VVTVDVNGRPAPKGSRVFGRTKAGNTFTRPASQYEKPWVEEVKRATQIAMRHHPQPEPPYAVQLVFRLDAPKKNRAAMPWWPTRHDLDKLTRAVVDGLVSGGAMKDDRHVIELTARKRYLEDGETQGVDAQISTASVQTLI
jgi:Holliday junction resolvase RusA-like endonuclease